jgi:uncharacterized protein (DUF433 family)
MPTKSDYPHVVLNDQRVPIIEGTTMKVVELVAVRDAYGWSPEELQFQFPYLTQSQIHAALAYYWDYREELERQVAQQVELYESRHQEQVAAGSPLRRRVRAKGLL